MLINAENRVQNVLVSFDCVFNVITLENPGFYDNAHLLDILGINVFNHRISAFADSTKGLETQTDESIIFSTFYLYRMVR